MLAPGKVQRVRRGTSTRPGFRPTLDTLEARQLLTVAPFLQGTVFADGNGNGRLDTNEAPLAGATIDLYAANSATRLATTTTGADGGYLFNSANVTGGLTVGATYKLVESASGYTSTGAQALSTVNPASVTAPNTIQVTVVDPNNVAAVFNSPASYGNPPYDGINLALGDNTAEPNPTQLNFTLSGDANLSGSSFSTLCVGLRDILSFNTPFATSVVPETALPNGGQIAYLYNHYGLTTLSETSAVPASIQGLSAKNLAAGLQLAVWELEYGSSLTLTGYDPTYTSAQDYADLQAAAAGFIADAVGKSEKVAVLDASLTGQLPAPTVTAGGQSILAALSYNFGNKLAPVAPGSISGVVFADKIGDGLSDDDAPLAGVTVQLVNLGGTVLATRQVGTNGAYSFNNLAPGTYTVKEVVPAGYVQTAPDSLVYTVPLAAGQIVTGDNFDNYKVDCNCPISKISYSDVGAKGIFTFSSLGGNTSQGDQVTVNFTVGGNSPVTVSFVTYTASSNFDLTKQAIFDVDTQTFAPGPHSLTVTIPNSYYQIDFVCGGAISKFNPSANITYHGEGRFIDADHGGTESAPTAFASLAGAVFLDHNYDGNFGSKDAGLGGVTVKLTGKDSNGQSVALTRITAKDGSYNFSGLQPGTYKVSEVTPGGYFTTKNAVGTVGGQTVGNLGTDSISAITLAGGTAGVNYNFGEQAVGSALGCNQTASVGFWNGCAGQSLIRSLNGGSSSTKLGTWLATQFPNSLSSLAGKTNAQVASFYQSAYSQCRYSSLTEGMATALAVYATDSSLAGGNYAGCYGFKVTAAGAGVATIDIGNTFACYGGPTGKVSLLQLLQYADSKAGSCDFWLQYRLACVFDYVNGCGSC